MDHDAPPPPRPPMPSVHFLDFSDRIDPPVDRSHVLWHLNIGKPPMKRARGSVVDGSGDDGPESSYSRESTAGPWRGMREGDVVVFPPAVGNITFESVRFVGRKSAVLVARDGEAWHEVIVPLMTAGFEYPEFPSLVVSYAYFRGLSLRELYEGPFDAVSSYRTGGRTLSESFAYDGAPEGAYEMFWDDAKGARRRRPPESDPWKFSLGDCVWISTAVFEHEDASSSSKAVGGGVGLEGDL
jgi:hypothetical protein